jgi:hypothetical protein
MVYAGGCLCLGLVGAGIVLWTDADIWGNIIIGVSLYIFLKVWLNNSSK